MDKLIPVLVDPPLSEGREFVCLWLNKNQEAKKPSHYLITKEQLVNIMFSVYVLGLQQQGYDALEFLKINYEVE